jgi:hypothetical protein
LKDAAQGKFTGAAVQEKKFNFHFCIPWKFDKEL